MYAYVRNKKLRVNEEKGENYFFKCLLKCQLPKLRALKGFSINFFYVLPRRQLFFCMLSAYLLTSDGINIAQREEDRKSLIIILILITKST